MSMRLNRAVTDARPSAIREFSRMAKETPGCIALTLGEPDFDTPAAVRDAAKLALDSGDTHYIENCGSAELRQAIAAFERSHNGMDYDSGEVIVTVGATQALFTALLGILEPGDEVVVPTPAFGLYESIVGLCRGRFVPLSTVDSQFQITREMLEDVLTPRTKAIILNSPNNPTGCVYTPQTLQAVHDAVAARDVFVICDDVYRQLVYSGSCHSFAEFRDLREKIIVVQSFSKPYAMTGWRMGYLLADRPVRRELEKVHQFCVVSSASISQSACVAALSCDPTPMRETYRRRRDYALRRLMDIGLEVLPPDGAFYLFPSIAPFGMDSAAFCTRMIREAGLAATPGFCFGSDQHIRLTYCYDDRQLAEGFDRLERFVRQLKNDQ